MLHKASDKFIYLKRHGCCFCNIILITLSVIFINTEMELKYKHHLLFISTTFRITGWLEMERSGITVWCTLLADFSTMFILLLNIDQYHVQTDSIQYFIHFIIYCKVKCVITNRQSGFQYGARRKTKKWPAIDTDRCIRPNPAFIQGKPIKFKR